VKWHCGIGTMSAQGQTFRYLVAARGCSHQSQGWIALYDPPDAPPGAFAEIPGRYTITRREAMAKAEAFEADLVLEKVINRP
jgi:hypothetical protein